MRSGGRLPCGVVAATDAVDVRRLRRSALVAGIGDGVTAVALPLLAAGLTRDPLAVAGVVAAQHLPWVILALALPALRGVDRRTLAGAGGSLAAIAVAFAGMSAIVGDETITLLQVVAFVLGAAQALDDDAQRVAGQTFPDLGRSSAHGTLATAGLLGLGLVGLPLGGFLYELLAPIPLLFGVGVFAVAALLALVLKRPLLPAAERDGRTSPRPSRLPPGAGLVTAATAVATAASGAVAGTLVLLALDDLGLGAPAFGLLLAGLGASALVGALTAPAIAQATSPRIGSVVALIGSAAGLVATWVLLDPDQPAPAVVALGAATAGSMAAGVLLRVQLQGSAAARLDEEGMRTFHLIVWAATPIGALLGGLAARSLGVADVLLGAVAAAAVAAVLASLATPPKPVATTS